MAKKIISAIYVIALLVTVVCVPLAGIFLIVKLCGVSTMPWIGCCMPLIVALAVSPLLLIAKFLIDQKEG